jgi:hypothetical protein
MENGQDRDPAILIEPHLVWLRNLTTATFTDNLVALYLYGSQAQGEADLSSDIDICAVTTGMENATLHKTWMNEIHGYDAVWIDAHVITKSELGPAVSQDMAASIVAMKEHGILLAGHDIRATIGWPGDDKIRRNILLAATASVNRILESQHIEPNNFPSIDMENLRHAAFKPTSPLSLTGTVLNLARAILYLNHGELVLSRHKLADAWLHHGNKDFARICQAALGFKEVLGSLGPTGAPTSIPVEVADGFVMMVKELAQTLNKVMIESSEE